MKCKVCGEEFEIKKDNKYIAQRQNIFTKQIEYFDCFDCTKCGCQNCAGTRMLDAYDVVSDIVSKMG